MAEGDAQNLVNRGLISQKSYGEFIKKFNPQFAAGESKAGAPAKAPLDIRPPAARNKPKPKHAKETDHGNPRRRQRRRVSAKRAQLAQAERSV
jgi:hypothetical protein